MNKFKTQAFFREFPFLTKEQQTNDISFVLCPNVDEVEEVFVSRIDKDFLKRVPQYSGATGSLVGIDDEESICLLDKNGDFLTSVKQGGDCIHNEGHTDDEHWDGETVGEALLQTNPEEVHYAVLIHTGYEIQDHHSVGGYSMTLYKPPKGFSLPEWVKEQEKRAEELIKAQVAEIDTEAK